MRECVCNNCGMEFEIEKLDLKKTTMKNGQEVEVLSFTCPKCDDEFVVTVRDKVSAVMQKEFQRAKQAYSESYDKNNEDAMRKARREMDFKKKQMLNYMDNLKKKYLKELRKRG